MDPDSHHAIVSEDQADLLPNILLPLAGPEELSDEDMEGMPMDLQLLPDTKKRESDNFLRKELLEAVLALCTTRPVRDVMRARKVYPILREAHLNETDPACEETIQKIVELLMGNEEDGSGDKNEMFLNNTAKLFSQEDDEMPDGMEALI
jgi:hypothetical protein